MCIFLGNCWFKFQKMEIVLNEMSPRKKILTNMNFTTYKTCMHKLDHDLEYNEIQ